MPKKKEKPKGRCIDCIHAELMPVRTKGNPIIIRCMKSGEKQVAEVHHCNIGQFMNK